MSRTLGSKRYGREKLGCYILSLGLVTFEMAQSFMACNKKLPLEY